MEDLILNDWCELIKWLTEYYFGNVWHWTQLMLLTLAFMSVWHVTIRRKNKDEK